MEYGLFTVIDTSTLARDGEVEGGDKEQGQSHGNLQGSHEYGQHEPEQEAEHTVVDMNSGEDLFWYDPESLISQALLMLSSARVKGVCDYLFDLPGGKDFVKAFLLFIEASRFLSDKILAYETIAYCPTCCHYFEGRCTRDGVFVEDDECCDNWTIRRTGMHKQNAKREEMLCRSASRE